MTADGTATGEPINPQRALLGLAVSLAVLSAVIHLTLGFGELLSGGVVLMPVLFVLVAIVVFGLLTALAVGVVAQPALYLAGGSIMALQVIAYADVHAFGFVESVTGADFHDHGPDDHGHDDHGPDDHGHDDHGHSDDGHSHDHGPDDHGHDDHGHGDHGHDDHGYSDAGYSHDHDHDGSALDVLADHLLEDAIALATKVSETVAAVAFFTLYVLRR